MIAHDEFLRQPFGDVRRDTADILADKLDLFAGDSVAVLLDVELDGIVHLGGSVSELPGIWIDDADLDRVLRSCRTKSA